MKKEEKILIEKIKKMNSLKSKKSKSAMYWNILSFLAGYENSYDLQNKYRLQPPPKFVDMTGANSMRKAFGLDYPIIKIIC